MLDNLSPRQRKYCMSRVKGKDTGIEKQIRSSLHRRGYRFRKHVKLLPGTPDIVLSKYKTVIFIHGCFWHGHQDCPRGHLPSTNKDIWRGKISQNTKRDQANLLRLNNEGWHVVTVWQCEISSKNKLTIKIEELDQILKRENPHGIKAFE